MRVFRPGLIARLLYPEAICRVRQPGMLLFLTFDDGPSPASTPVLLSILEKAGVKAAFFLSGKLAEKHPELVNAIRSAGHLTGNHGYDHIEGLKTTDEDYLADAGRAAAFTSSEYFRPPYGLMKLSQYRKIKDVYRVILWDLMPYDFDEGFGPENTLRILKSKIRPGSVIVLHDNPSSCAEDILEDFITHARMKGYEFGVIQETLLPL